jgi:hypothetical protein
MQHRIEIGRVLLFSSRHGFLDVYGIRHRFIFPLSRAAARR